MVAFSVDGFEAGHKFLGRLKSIQIDVLTDDASSGKWDMHVDAVYYEPSILPFCNLKKHREDVHFVGMFETKN